MKIKMLIKTIPVLLVGLAATSNAASIAWTVDTVNDINDISTTGTPVEAFNTTGDASVSTEIVNGVTFVGKADLWATSDDGDVFSGTTGDSGYDALLSTLDWGGGSSTTISIGGGTLSIGQQYEVQLWYNQTDKTNRSMTYGDGETVPSTISVDGNVQNVLDPTSRGQFATGTFIADGTSQTITMASVGMGNSQLNAYQLRAIPEPSSSVMLAFALGSLVMVRRRRNAA